MMGWVVCLLVLTVSLTSAWSDLYDNEFKRWALARRSDDGCMSSGGKCYSTSDCCEDYVCAAFDDFGLSPTMPGWCVHEKELDPCVNYMDCEEGTECRALDGHRYCVPLTRKEIISGKGKGSGINSVKGFSGTNCEDERDCAKYDKDGKTKLCCQKIRMGRAGIRKKCDPITPISVCVNMRK